MQRHLPNLFNITHLGIEAEVKGHNGERLVWQSVPWNAFKTNILSICAWVAPVIINDQLLYMDINTVH